MPDDCNPINMARTFNRRVYAKRPELLNCESTTMGLKYRIGAWLAILSITLNALWPLIANAQPQSIPTEICSADGAKAMSRAEGGQNLPAPPAHHDKLASCCYFCVNGVHAAPLAPAPAGFVPGLTADPLLFASADAVTWKCPYYLPTLSRGPPAHVL